MRVLITGMTGFIGHHVAEHFLKVTDHELVGVDRIDATSTLHRLRHVDGWERYQNRVKFVWHDLRAPINKGVNASIGPVDVALHLAASTHVDRSIDDPTSFVMDNVVGTLNLLDWWRERPGKLLLYFGTDEVFGPAPEGTAYKEWDRYSSTNPYSASKAGAEELVGAFSNTYRFKAVTTHTMNVFGERQHPEKFIPMTISKILRGETVLIHSNSDRTVSGSRFYLHANNVGHALAWLVEKCSELPRYDKWNLVGEMEISNLEMAQTIANILGKPLHYDMIDFHSSRPGHDLRYALDGRKLKEAGFEYPMSLQKSLERTVRWFLDHPDWLNT